MNTTQKGNKLENQVFSVFQEEILNNRFYAKKEFCRIYQQKGYYSKDRDKEIIFDVSIEIFLPDQNTYSHLILIECKNYSTKPVPVDDIEEFHAKFQQIGSNIKGIVVTTSSFQEDALKYSRSKGIGLLRYFSRANLDWVLTRSPSSLLQYKMDNLSRFKIIEGLCNQEHKSHIFDWYCASNDSFFTSINDFLSNFLTSKLSEESLKDLYKIKSPTKKCSYLVKFIDKNEIESCALKILEKYKYKSGAVSLEDICNKLQRSDNLKYLPATSLDPGVLGKITYDPFTIFIDVKQTETIKSFRFTLAHELEHYFLNHQKYMYAEKCYKDDIDLENPRVVNVQDIRRIEWQANYFASCLLLPKVELTKDFFKIAQKLDLHNRGAGWLYLDNQKCNIDIFYNITNLLKNKFQVSRSVIKIRLKELGILNESEKFIPNKSFHRTRFTHR